MSLATSIDLREYCLDLAQRARAASALLARVRGEQKDRWLRQCAQALRDRHHELLAANQLDLAAAPNFGLSDAQIDRLRLTSSRIEDMSTALDEIAALPNPIGEVIQSSIRPNGLEVQKVRVPLGVVFFIYESRPNVTADAAAICLKSGNAVLLRGGKEAANSNQAIVQVMCEVAAEVGLPGDALQLVAPTDRAAVGHLLAMPQYIDVAIPRGGESLIRRVAAEAKMPVIKHFTGNCHVYIDRAAHFDMAAEVLINSKCQRLGVCNAAESMLIHADVAAVYLPRLAQDLIERGIEIRGDERTLQLVPGATRASEEDFAAEFLGPIISCRVVGSLDEAIAHIERYGSRHTEAIVTCDLSAAREFAARVDSAAIVINASTRFNDGGEIGLGAEIGISTDKFHARGPCGLRELTSYKYIIYGSGQVRQ